MLLRRQVDSATITTPPHSITVFLFNSSKAAAAIFFSNLGDLMILNTSLKFNRNSGIILPENSPNKRMQYHIEAFFVRRYLKNINLYAI